MTNVRTLILGGGMSGLSCAYHLSQQKDDNYLLLERSDEPGGLSRSIKQDGFVFDHTGHLLHLHNPYTQKLIPELLGDNLVENKRAAWIYSHGAYTRYPFQANTYGLPLSVRLECLWGLLWAQMFEAHRPSDKLKFFTKDDKNAQGPLPFAAPGGVPERRRKQTFEDWVLRTFGEGFGEHFSFPYNKKLWTVAPDELTTEWLGSFVPKPSLWEVFKGAFTDQTKKFGYNATFYYPKEGGIQALAFAFARGLQKNIRLNTEVASIDLKAKQVTTRAGEIIGYEHLVSSLPLIKFLDMAAPMDAEVRAKKSLLRWTSVYNLNLGVERAALTDKHWIYFPEEKYPFYRVGFPMNFAPSMTPPGCSSMYIEIAHEPGHPPNGEWALEKSLEGLYNCGLLDPKDRILTKNILPIPVAYVIYDTNWKATTDYLLALMASQNVHSIGRFGGWKYSYMEEAILEGKATAEKITGQTNA